MFKLWQFFIAGMIVVFTLIIPIQILEQSRIESAPPAPYTRQALQERSSDEGRVAGISDSRTSVVRIPLTNITIDTQTKAGQMTLLGSFVMVVGVLLGTTLLYLLWPKKYAIAQSKY